MFGSKRKALESEIQELKRQLDEEKAAHEADSRALDEMRGRMEREERTLSEIRCALRKTLGEIDERARQCELEQEAARQSFQQEMQSEREQTRKDLEQYRKEQKAALQQRVKDFNRSYNVYLAQIQQAMNCLTDTSLQIGSTFLQEDDDVAELFHTRISGALDTKAEGEDQHNDLCTPFI